MEVCNAILWPETRIEFIKFGEKKIIKYSLWEKREKHNQINKTKTKNYYLISISLIFHSLIIFYKI